MKKLFVLLFISITFYNPLFAQTEWNWITQYPSGIYPVDSYQIEGKIFYIGESRAFYYTSDGGNSFNITGQYAPVVDNEFYGDDRMAFGDSLHGIIIDVNMTYKTSDGGKHWLNAFGPNNYFKLVDFGSPKVGWLYGEPGIYKTTDSGNTWEIIGDSSLDNISGFPSCIYALDENKVWICKSFNISDSGAICFSSDGGLNWSKQNSIVSDTNSQVYYKDIKVTNSGLGIAIGWNVKNSDKTYEIPFLLRTTDFGNHWKNISIDTSVGLNIIVSKNDNEWLILGSKELKSNDSGKTWNYSKIVFKGATYSTDGPVTAEYIKSRNILLVSGASGIYRSLDFGNTFNRLSNKNEILIDGFDIDKNSNFNIQLAAAVSKGDSFIVSEDGGRNWQKKYLTGIGNFTGGVTVAQGIICAEINYHLFKSTDQGNSWTKIFDNYGINGFVSAYDQNNIAFIAHQPNTAFLYYSKDGGNSWFKSPFFQSCSTLELIGPGKILAGGNGNYATTSNIAGYLYSSDDYGKDWHVVDTKYKITKIKQINQETYFALSTNDIYRSSDKGNIWSMIFSLNDYSYPNFAFKDSLNGTLKIDNDLYESKDAGFVWRKINSSLPFRGKLKFMDYNKFGDLIIIGDGGMCISINNNIIPSKNINENLYHVEEFALSQNYPNPFNPTTKIKYSIPRVETGYILSVQLKVYDILGNEIATLVNKQQSPGEYEIEFDAGKYGLSSGIYFYQLKAGSFVQTKKLVLLK